MALNNGVLGLVRDQGLLPSDTGMSVWHPDPD